MARKERRIVPIPGPPKNAFDKNRPAGALLRAQTLHLRHGLARHLQRVTRHLDRVAALLAIDVDTVRTEGEVSEYARQVTAILHVQPRKRTRK